MSARRRSFLRLQGSSVMRTQNEVAAMDNGTEFSILMDIATKLPADSEEFQLTAGLAAYHLYMAHELGEVPEHMRARFESFFNKKAAHA